MDGLAEKRFAEILTMLESLEAVYARSVSKLEKDQIKSTISRIMGEMTDQQLAVYQLYVEQRLSQANSTLNDLQNTQRELQNEKERRRRE